MANTRDTLGDQATLDGLVNGTLTELEENGVTSLPSYALHKNTHIETLKFPNVTSISADAFNGCSALKHLVLGSSTKCTLSATSAFTGTPISMTKGAIYVPKDLVSAYKADSNWKNYFITSDENYPTSEYSTITDSWAQIVAAISDGSYATKYNVGDTKAISINGVDDYMVLIAKDTDVLADGSGNAKTTWLSKGLFATHNMNTQSTNANGWAQSGMRTWLRETILPTLDSTIRSGIKEVTKTYYDKTTSSTLSVSDTVWIPSAREMFGGTSYEDSGCDYTSLFNSNSARIKYNTSGSANIWWLRSANSNNDTNFRFVNTNGIVSGGSASIAYGVALGFSI